MDKTEQNRLIKLLMERLDSGTTVDAGGQREFPTSVYTCSELAAQEWDTFFRNTPQIIGMSGDLPEPGSFTTHNDWGIPILATRDDEGKFHAHLNACRHRSVVVESEARGNRSRFTCPFHAWTYSNQGELVGLPKKDHFGDIDKSCHGLISLPAVECYGFLWVHPDPKGTIDVDDLLGGLASEFESWGFESLVSIGYDTYDVPLNWKLAMDTFGETYHFNTLHKNTLALSLYGNVQCYDVFDRNHRMMLCLRSIDELRGLPEEDWDVLTAALPVYYLFPNIQINVLSLGIVLVRAYPDPKDPTRSISQMSFYAWPEAVKDQSEDIRLIMQDFVDIIRDEDYAVAARSQTGANSGILDTVLFGRNEPALHHYHNTYRVALGMEPVALLD